MMSKVLNMQVEQKRVKAEAETALIRAQNEAEIKRMQAQAESVANNLKDSNITESCQNERDRSEIKAWLVEVQGIAATVVKDK